MIVLVLPGFLPGERFPNLNRLAESGRVHRLTPLRGMPEAAWLGLPAMKIADGPLIVAALGHEPPERSIQFHLSVLGVSDGTIVSPPPPSPAEAAVIAELLPKLNTKRLTTLAGPGVDHALVLEDFWDLGTTPRDEAIGKPLPSVLPEGEAEEILRRLIDDSVNMLSELEFNRRRVDEEKLPLNLLWPWGHGAPRRLSNLALHRGAPATVESDSLRLQGLARLSGYRHHRLPGSLELDWESLATRAKERPVTIAAVEMFPNLDEEQFDWLATQMDRRLFPELKEEKLLLAAYNSEGGLLLELSDAATPGSVPFHSDVVEDSSIPKVDLHEAIDRFLTE